MVELRDRGLYLEDIAGPRRNGRAWALKEIGKSTQEGSVESAPATAMDRRQAQVGRRGDVAGRQDSVGQLKQLVRSLVHALVEFLTKVSKAYRGHTSGPRINPLQGLAAVHGEDLTGHRFLGEQVADNPGNVFGTGGASQERFAA